ncbi:predicted protein [Sclerotinia sclerotiorum 1980 UF-70]|uniref:Rhodopsin domain-containing protein n=1 Tax=Sclerotinia sclerotiorum (strain ATCC 18683 / 1980 / Ss-1) TaxID=665079 RepID=A7F6A4_SCLS1|nr:predicted protein [Sclerotinia sclerotiorum 1980 UF-70]EDN98275.1 predicted protein [Sclerotinia sclerotiorum 1980 UF-70]
MSTGLLPPPSGVTPNFNSGILSGTQVAFILAYTITLALASSTLGIRLYTRISIMKSFGLDDVAILLSFQLSPMVATYALAPAFTKLSILILLHRVNPSRYFRLSCYIVALIIITYTLTISLIVAIPCIPTNPKNGECLNKCGLWQAIFNILTDSAILILPSYMLYLLKLPLRQKLAVGSIFGTGILTVEVNIGIFCNTLVVLRPFFRQYFPGLFSSQILSDDHHHHHGTPDHEANLRSGKRRILKLREDHSLSTLAINNRVGEEDKEPGILRRFEVKVESFSIGGSSDERTRRDSEEEIQR